MAGWEDFRFLSPLDLARECLRMDGLDPEGLTRSDVAIAALGWPAKTAIRGDRGLFAACNTTGSFAKLTQDAMHKSMMVGYQEYVPTWRMVGRQGTSVPDFKQIHRMRIGAVPNAQAWADNTEPADVSFADSDEPYTVECFSEKMTLSYRLLVNDDVDAFSRLPFMFAQALLRTQNAQFWSQITGNPTLSAGGQPLFCSATAGNRLQVNSFTGVNPPSTGYRGHQPGRAAPQALLRTRRSRQGH